MKVKNIISLIRMASNRIYWCIRKGFPLRLALCDIQFKDIPASTYFSHPYGITIGKGTILGEHCVIGSNVTIGTRRPFFNVDSPELPAIIEDECFLSNNCVIIGNITIGKNSIVGASAVVLQSIPQKSVVAGNPAKVIGASNWKINF